MTSNTQIFGRNTNNATSRPSFHCYFGWKEERESRPVVFIIISGVERFWNMSLSFNGEAQGVYDCGRWRGWRWFDRWLTSFVWSWQSEVWTSRVAIERFTAFGWETSKTQGVLVSRLEADKRDLLHAYGIRFHTFSTFCWWESKKERKQKGPVPMFTHQYGSTAKSLQGCRCWL